MWILTPSLTSRFAHTPDMERNGPNGNSGTYLAGAVKQEQWITPQSGDVTGSTHNAIAMWAAGTRPKTSDQRLRTQVAAMEQRCQWATPKTPTGGPESAQRKQELGRMESGGGCLASQANGKLNPRWVETLMGLPVGWVMPSCQSPVTIAPTNSGCSAMALSLPPQSGLLELSLGSSWRQ